MLVYLISSDDELLSTLNNLIKYTHKNECCTFKKTCGLVDALKTTIPDLIVTGLKLDKGDGIKLIQYLKAKNAACKILVCANTKHKMEVIRAFAAGANGFVSKQEAPESFIDCMQQVSNCETVVSHEVKNIMVNFFRENSGVFLQSFNLSHAEQTVADMLSDGGSIKEMAEQVNVSHDTIKTHCKNIYKKLKARNKTHAVKILISSRFMNF